MSNDKRKSSERLGSYRKDRMFAVREAYRSIRTNINLFLNKSGCKKLVFTSALQGEGKTVTSCNIAFSMAQTEARVLFIDTDMRRPRVHRVMKLPNGLGLSDILSGKCSLEEGVSHTKYAKLDVITAGSRAFNPAELLASEAMERLLAEAEKQYDCILLDAPPVNVVSDVLPVAKMADGVVLVVRQKYSTVPVVKKAVQSLRAIGANILGVVLNFADIRDYQEEYQGGRGYRYTRRYGYGYGDRSVKGSSVDDDDEDDDFQA